MQSTTPQPTRVPAQRTAAPFPVRVHGQADRWAWPAVALTAVKYSVARVLAMLERTAPVMLRLSLALVFLWFGALKVSGDSPVLTLVQATLPFGDPNMVMVLLGAVEIAIGIGLLLGQAQRLLLLVLAGHLTGTFLTFVMAPELTFQHGNLLLLTADGEFVLKNLVLISAALLLAARPLPAGRRPTEPKPA